MMKLFMKIPALLLSSNDVQHLLIFWETHNAFGLAVGITFETTAMTSFSKDC